MKTFRSLQLDLWSARVLRLVVALCASLIAACGGGYGSSSGGGGMSSSAPTITTQPQNQTVTAPAAAMFSVAASNPSGYSGMITYQWMRGGTNIMNATAATYSTGPTSASDNGAMFQVKVTNAYGTTASSQVMLTVH